MTDLPAAVATTVRHLLDGSTLDTGEDWHTVVANVGDDLTGELSCPDHEVSIADVTITVTVARERDCTECEIASCNDCSPWHHFLCGKHRDAS